MSVYPANRVVQLDARSLDDCLLENFQVQLDKIASALFSTVKWQIAYNESRLFLLPVLYYIPQIFKGQSPGQQIMNIGFHNYNSLPSLFNYMLSVLMPSLLKLFLSLAKDRQLHNLLEKVCGTLNLLNFIYFFKFVSSGGPAKVEEKLLGLQTVYQQKPYLDQINYAGLNRELIGHSLGHLFLLLAPAIQLCKSRILPYIQTKTIPKSCFGEERVMCAECNQVAVLPVLLRQQGHQKRHREASIYCYYCFHLIHQDAEFVFLVKGGSTEAKYCK